MYSPSKSDSTRMPTVPGKLGGESSSPEPFNSPAFIGMKTDTWQSRMANAGKHAFKKNQFLQQEQSGYYARAPNPSQPPINAPAQRQQLLARELHGVFPVTGSEPARPKTSALTARGRPSPRTNNIKQSNMGQVAVTQTGRPMTAEPHGVRSLREANSLALNAVNRSADEMVLSGRSNNNGSKDGFATNRLNQAFNTTYPANDPGKMTARPKKVSFPKGTKVTQKMAGTGIYNPAIETPRPGAASDPTTNPVLRKEYTPHFVEYTKKVLTFEGYYNDTNSFETNTLGYPSRNSHIVRKVMIYFHLEDASVNINEVRQENSGRMQGNIHRRAVAYHPDGTTFVPGDFRVGGKFKLNGIEYFICDANKVTREFYKRAMGITVPEAVPFPADESNLSNLRAEHTTGLGGVRDINHYNRLGQDTRNAKRTTIFAEAHHTQANKDRKFLQHDRHVLRFNCVWNDDKPNGKQHQFVVLYFLADDTVEVRTIKERNAGRDDYPCLLRRQKLPKEWDRARTGAETMQRGEGGYVSELDLRCGEYLNLYGRHLLLTTCDEFTKQFYLKEYGVEQVDCPLKQEVNQPVSHEIPKAGESFMMIGREEDSLKTVYGLTLPGKTAEQLFATRERSIRASMRMVDEPEREFALTFNLENEELMVYEIPKKNSGRVAGKFVRSDKYYNPEARDIPMGQNGRYFRADDFYIGAIIKLHTGNRMEILDMDDHSLNYMEDDPKSYPLSDFNGHIAGKILDVIRSGDTNLGGQNLREVLREQDPQGTGMLQSRGQMEQALGDLNLLKDLTKHEVNTIFRKFAERFKGKNPVPMPKRRFNYNIFCDTLVRIHRRERGFQTRSEFPLTLSVNTLLWRQLLERNDPQHSGVMPLSGIDSLLGTRRAKLTQPELDFMAERYRTSPPAGQSDTNIWIDYMRFCDDIYVCVFE